MTRVQHRPCHQAAWTAGIGDLSIAEVNGAAGHAGSMADLALLPYCCTLSLQWTLLMKPYWLLLRSLHLDPNRASYGVYNTSPFFLLAMFRSDYYVNRFY